MDGVNNLFVSTTPQKKVPRVGAKYLPPGLFGPPSPEKSQKKGAESPNCESKVSLSKFGVEPGEESMSLYSAPSEISGGTGHIFEMGTPLPICHQNGFHTTVC